VSTLFFCQILDMHLSIFSQIGVFLTSIMAGMGATGIPEGGLVTMIMVLRSVNVPASAIALLLPFDRILDRFRTMVNVWGDLVCAAAVDHFSKKTNNTNVINIATNIQQPATKEHPRNNVDVVPQQLH
jgi:Na+/H+-dicarboxylate symporter